MLKSPLVHSLLEPDTLWNKLYSLNGRALAELDNLTQLVAQFFDVPIAAFALTDAEQTLFKSYVGEVAAITLRDPAIYRTILAQARTTQVNYKSSISAEPGLITPICFYMGRRIHSLNRRPIAVMVIADDKPRHFSVVQKKAFTQFTKQFEILVQRIEEKISKKTLYQLIDNHEHYQWKQISQSPIGISYLSLSRDYLQVNSIMARMLGYREEEMIGKHISQFMHPVDKKDQEKEQLTEQLLSGKISSFITQKRYFKKNGEMIWILIISFLVFNPRQKQRTRLIELAVDITDQVILQEHYKFEAQHDMLTGLLNRRAFMAELNRIIHDLVPDNVAMLFLDLDNFKEINDTYGHLVGDQALVQFAMVLRNVLPEHGLLARLSGDEFVILYDNLANPDQFLSDLCHTIIDKLKCSDKTKHIEGINIILSTSIGAVCVDDVKGLSAKALLACADAAMYQAKENNKGGFFITHLNQDEVVHGVCKK